MFKTNRDRERLSWQNALALALVSVLLAAIITGLVAFIADHIVWG